MYECRGDGVRVVLSVLVMSGVNGVIRCGFKLRDVWVFFWVVGWVFGFCFLMIERV